MDRRFIEPYKDMFNLYNLITKINKNYALYFDKKNKCFLVLNTLNNFEVCYKFYNFSNRIFDDLLKTQIKNSQSLFESINKHNEELQNKMQKNIIENSKEILKDKIKTSNKVSKILP